MTDEILKKWERGGAWPMEFIVIRDNYLAFGCPS